MSENDDEIVTVRLPKWKLEKLDQMIDDRKAYDVLTAKLKNYWIWAVVAGAGSVFILWDTIKMKVGG